MARQILDFIADQETQSRVDDLAAKSSRGQLSEQERVEYWQYVDTFNLVAQGTIFARVRTSEMNGAYRRLVRTAENKVEADSGARLVLRRTRYLLTATVDIILSTVTPLIGSWSSRQIIRASLEKRAQPANPKRPIPQPNADKTRQPLVKRVKFSHDITPGLNLRHRQSPRHPNMHSSRRLWLRKC